MKLLTAIFSLTLLASPIVASASSCPDGDITFYNSSTKNIKAEVTPSSSFTLASNEKKTISYSSLSYVCSDNPTNCEAKFYVNDVPAGKARINVEQGKLISMQLSVKVKTTKSDGNVLRTVTIK